MKLEHIAIWAKDLELMRAFYCKYFNMTCGEKYHNSNKNFTSYFLSFSEGDTRIEIMNKPEVTKFLNSSNMHLGLTHFAISVGDRQEVDELTEELRRDGYTIIGEPRVTGDGYYESVIEDPEGNLLELTE